MQPSDLVDRLRAIGYRMTAQRAALLKAIWKLDAHFTAEQVRQALPQAERPDLSTIYRTLDLLCEVGALHALTGVTPTEYERAREPHHHLLCRDCGTVTVLADYHLDSLIAHLLDEHGFAAELSHLAIPGRCLPCRNGSASAG